MSAQTLLLLTVVAPSAVLVGVTLLPLSSSTKWWIRVWDFPRIQLAVGLGAACLAQAALPPHGGVLGHALLTATAGCLVWQVWQIWPYTPAHRLQVLPAERPDPPNTVRLLIANVLQHNRDAAAFLARVAEADPDIVLTVETNGWWDERIVPPLAERYLHHVRHPLENTYGIHLFSRLELSDVRVLHRVVSDIPSISARVRLRSGRLVDLHCLHPEPPRPGVDNVAEQSAELLLVAEEVSAARRPAIVCGDLNDVAWSHTTRLFQRVSGLLDPRVGRGLYATFHAEHPLARWPLDHVFHDASFRLSRLEVLGYFGSDHFPVLVELVHDPAGAEEHERPEPDIGDREEARERIREGREAAAEEEGNPDRPVKAS